MTTSTDNHSKALRYWKKCTNSYLAAPEYYQQQEDALIEILANIEPCERALDIGCGDGRYTLVLKGIANSVLGIDVAPALIEQADMRLTHESSSGIAFQVDSIESLAETNKYDLIACMGVTSGLIDESVFKKAISDISAALKPGGKLIIKDTVSLENSEVSSVGEYVAIYRSKQDYLRALAENGFIVEKELELSRTDNGMVNSIRLARLLESNTTS